MPQVSFTLNGDKCSADVAPNRVLSDFLRDDLDLTGTHVGCDTSQCGACMIHMNGDSVKSCSVLTIQCEGAEITTIEGMADGDQLHPVQEAFREAHGLQCGYCTPGMIMSISDLLKKQSDPSESQVREWLEGNICRCTGYQNIIKAALLAAKKMAA